MVNLVSGKTSNRMYTYTHGGFSRNFIIAILLEVLKIFKEETHPHSVHGSCPVMSISVYHLFLRMEEDGGKPLITSNGQYFQRIIRNLWISNEGSHKFYRYGINV